MSTKSPALGLVAAILAYFALWVIVPRAAFLPPIVLLVLCTVAFMGVQIAIVYFFARLNMNWWQSLVALAVCVAGVAGLLQIVIAAHHIAVRLGYYPGLKAQFVILGTYGGWLRAPMVLLTMLAAASIGCAVSSRITDRNLLLPVVMFAACIDVWTVTRGPVAAMLQRVPEVAAAVAAPIPKPGAGTFTPISSIGPGDFLFAALVFAAISRLGLNARRNYWFVFAAFSFGMVVLVPLFGYLPALTVLAVAVIAANWREFKLSRQEKISVAVVGVLLAVSVPLVWSMLAPPAHRPGKAISTPEHRRGKG